MNNLDRQYLDLLQDIKENGVKKEGRNGGTRSVFNRTIRHNMKEGFPLLTTKKMWWHGIVTELRWFLNGDTNIQWLLENGNTIWVGDAYRNYIDNRPEDYYDDTLTKKQFIKRIKEDDEFAEEWGNMGLIYGAQWTNCRGVEVRMSSEGIPLGYGITHKNQVEYVVDLLNNNPDSRRILVDAWNPNDINDMVLPPCHYSWIVYTRELSLKERIEYVGGNWENVKGELNSYYSDDELGDIIKLLNEDDVPKRGISLAWTQRSTDTPLGLPFNIASYGLLLKALADEVNMIPLDLVGNLVGDVHIYENQLEGVEKQLERDAHSLPEVTVDNGIDFAVDDIVLKNYRSEDKIDYPLSN